MSPAPVRPPVLRRFTAGQVMGHHPAPGGAGAPAPSVVAFVAHEDDDLLFLNPDILHYIAAGTQVQTVFVTAGDAGRRDGYYQAREDGCRAAYASMAGVSNSWTTADAGISGHAAPKSTLNGNTKVSLIWLRLPDGNTTGAGYPAASGQSLQKLWQGNISTIDAVDGSSTYSKASLLTVLGGLITGASATVVMTQDAAGSFGDADHSDHHASAFAALTAAQTAGVPAYTAYMGYDTNALDANVSGADLTAKAAAITAAQAYDGSIPTTWNTFQYTTMQGAYAGTGIKLVQAAHGTGASGVAVINFHQQAAAAGNLVTVGGHGWTGGGTPDLPTSITDDGGGANTWHYSSSISQNPPSDVQRSGVSNPGAFLAWCVLSAPVTQVTVTMASATYAQAGAGEWSGAGSVTTGATIENYTGAAVTAPAVVVPAGGAAVALAYPSDGRKVLGSQPAGTSQVICGNDAANWQVYKVSPAGETLSASWGVSVASVQVALAFGPS